MSYGLYDDVKRVDDDVRKHRRKTIAPMLKAKFGIPENWGNKSFWKVGDAKVVLCESCGFVAFTKEGKLKKCFSAGKLTILN